MANEATDSHDSRYENRIKLGKTHAELVPSQEVDFDWEAVDAAGAIDALDCREISDRAFSDSLAWIFSFVLAGSARFGTRLSDPASSVAFRRFIALAYVYRPDLLEGKTIRQLAKELEVSTQAVNKYIADVALEFSASGVNQRDLANRVACRSAQLQERIKANPTRTRNTVNSRST